MGVKETLQQALVQRQQQTLSPVQVMFVKMLEMSGPEIEENVRRELDENPALEEVDDVNDHERDPNNETAEQMQRADYTDDDLPAYRLEARNHSVNDVYHEPIAVAGQNLADFLMEQLGHGNESAETMEIAPFIIGNLDSNGYMRESLDKIATDIAITTGIEYDPRALETAYCAIRRLDPAGIGARDLRDCLLLQLRRLPSSPPVNLAIDILERHYDAYIARHYDKLTTALGVDRQALAAANDVIRSLNPKPAAAFDNGGDNDLARVIIPDFSVEAEGNHLELTLLNKIPELRISASFDDDSLPSSTASNSYQNIYITQQRNQADTYIKMLRMRRETLFKVMSAIVQLQRPFFLTGDESRIKPMILKDIGNVTGFDLSVISRAIREKYVATGGSIYPLKFFFNEGVATDSDAADEESASAHRIMAEIKKAVEAEDPQHPLSDLALTKMINDAGINVARRTVSKYRERLLIPKSNLRRKI